MTTNAFLIAFPMDSWRWTQNLLAECTSEELEALSLLMGIAKSGSKAVKIKRLLLAARVREVLTLVTDPAELVAAYTAKELRELCGWADVYTGGTKTALAVALLNWRNECRRKGQQVLKEGKESLAQKPFRQLRLFPA